MDIANIRILLGALLLVLAGIEFDHWLERRHKRRIQIWRNGGLTDDDAYSKYGSDDCD